MDQRIPRTKTMGANDYCYGSDNLNSQLRTTLGGNMPYHTGKHSKGMKKKGKKGKKRKKKK